jgi:hypothetical protein
MAEVASRVLHKVGNVLTSVNLTVDDLRDSVRESRVSHLSNLADCIEREQDRLPEFFGSDPVGRQLPGFLVRIARQLVAENARLAEGIGGLERHCNVIREVIVNQHTDAQDADRIEMLEVAPLVANVIRLEENACRREGMTPECRFGTGLAVPGNRMRFVQILLWLLQQFRDDASGAQESVGRVVIVANAIDRGIAFSVSPHDGPVSSFPGADELPLLPAEEIHTPRLQRCILSARAISGTLTRLPAESGGGFTLRLPLPSGAIPSHSKHES